MPIIRFFVIRHFKVTDSSKIYGSSDVPIQDFNISNVDLLQRLIPSNCFPLSSPLSRCVSTLEKVLDVMSIKSPIITDERLSEQNFGILELTTPSIKTFPNNRPYWHFPYDYKPEKGESFEDLYIRVNQFLEEKIKYEYDTNLLICTHGGILKAMLAYIFKFPLENCSILDIGPFSLTIFEYKDNNNGNKLWWLKAAGIQLLN